MPGMKGDEFLEKVYEEHPETKVIMITGHANQKALDTVNSIPSVCAVLKKPWDSEELRTIVEEACPV